jgi:GDP-L-fucose synthase
MDVISLMPTNLYGPGDNYHPTNSHVLAALLRRCHEAKVSGRHTIEVWGSGTPRREFLYADNLADAAVFALRSYEGEEHVNVGTGTDVTIRELAELIAETVGWSGELVFDTSKPDGMPRKLLDVSKLAVLGWTAGVVLRQGLGRTYRSFLETAEDAGASEPG